MEQLSLEVLAKALKDKGAIDEVGKARLRAAILNAAEEKAGAKPSNPMQVVQIEAGEQIPKFLAGTPGLSGAAGTAAASNWTKSWIDVSVWTRTWHEGSSAILTDDKDILRSRFADLIFSKDEINTLKDLGLSHVIPGNGR